MHVLDTTDDEPPAWVRDSEKRDWIEAAQLRRACRCEATAWKHALGKAREKADPA